jgi:hypothetical protein
MKTSTGTAARTYATAAGTLWLDTLLWAVHLAVRPPCPEGYVRLLDLAYFVPFVTGFLAVMMSGLWVGNRRNDSPRLGVDGGVAIAFTCLGLLLLLGAVGVLISDAHTYQATNCWTF